MRLHGPTDNLRKSQGLDTSFDGLQLKQENALLRDQLQRYEKELTLYQNRYPSIVASELDSVNTTWTAPEILSPLLIAYDSRIAELTRLIRDRDNELESLKSEFGMLVRENDELRAAQKSLRQPTGPSRDDLQTDLLSELYEKIDLLMKENSLLVEQKVSLGQELDKVAEENMKWSQEAASLALALEALKTENANNLNKIATLESERSEAAAHALKCSDALGKAEIEIESLSSQLEAVRLKVIQQEPVIFDLKNQVNSNAALTERSRASYLQQVQFAEERVRELHRELAVKDEELKQSLEASKKLRAEYQSTRNDAEGMLQVMSGLERQVNEFMKRELEIERLGRESKEKAEDALNLRDQCVIREEQLRKEIERLKAERKGMLVNHTADIESAVSTVRNQLSGQMNDMKTEIEELCKRNSELLCTHDSAVKDAQAHKESLEKLKRLHADERNKLNASLQLLQDQFKDLKIQKEMEESKKIDMNEQNKSLRVTLDKLRLQIDSTARTNEQAEAYFDTNMLSQKTQIRSLQKELADTARVLQRRNKEFEDLKNTLNGQVKAIEDKRIDELAELKQRAVEAERFCKDVESLEFSSHANSGVLIEQVKDKYLATVNALESKLKRETDACKSLMLKCKNFEKVFHELLNNKSTLISTVDMLQRQNSFQDEELQQFKKTIANLAAQLTTN